jgi:hypothetical protein
MATNEETIKPGYKSTEFYLSVIASVGLFYGIYVGFIPRELGATLITAILGLYGIERTLIKKEV